MFIGLGLGINSNIVMSASWWAASNNLLDGVAPGFFMDALNARHALNGASASLTDLVTVTNASTARTYVNQNGDVQTASANTPIIDWESGVPELLLEGSVQNVLTNTATLSTQSVTTTATTYTLSFRGTGSVTLSGTATGSKAGTGVNTRVSLTFTATSGTLTLTVSGSVTKAQLQTGSVASSYIECGASPVTKTADTCQLSSAAAAILQGAGAAVAWRGNVQALVASQQMLSGSSGTGILRANMTGANVVLDAGVDSDAVILATSVLPANVGIAAGWGASGKIGSVNGVAAVSSSVQIVDSRSAVYIGPSTGLIAGQILRVRQLVGWSLSDRPTSDGVTSQARLAA